MGELLSNIQYIVTVHGLRVNLISKAISVRQMKRGQVSFSEVWLSGFCNRGHYEVSLLHQRVEISDVKRGLSSAGG